MNEVEKKVSQLLIRYTGMVKGLAFRYAPIPDCEEDIAQQVFAEFLEKKDHWDLDSDIGPLLATMTRNIARRYWREKIRTMPETLRRIAEHVQTLSEQETGQTDQDDKLIALRNCMGRLPETSRNILDLHYSDGKPIKEIADQLKVTPNAVSCAICRIREKLKQCIEKYSF